MNENITLIQTIGEQWKFLLVTFFIIIFLIKWKTIWSLANNFTQIKIKRGENEIEVHREVSKFEEIASENKVEQKKIKPNTEVTEEVSIILEKVDTIDNINSLYFIALSEHKFSEAKIHFEKIIQSEKSPIAINERTIRNFYWRFSYGDLNAIDEFEKYILSIDGDNEQKSYALYYRGIIYKNSNNYKEAIELTKTALQLTNIDEYRTACIKELSSYYFENGDKEQSIEILIENIPKIDDRKLKSTLYSSIADFYKKTENKLFESIAYQKALELNPNDTNLLFNAAYNYSEAKNSLKDLSLLLYKKTLNFNSDLHGVLNNIGVAYQNLKLKYKSVNYYKKAYEKGSSLAASNLANLLMDKGFDEEALVYLDKAKTFSDVHENIFTAISALKNDKKEEKTSEEKILEIATKKYLFFNHFGSAIFTNNLIEIDTSKNWHYDEIKLLVVRENGSLNLKWEVGNEKHNIEGKITNNSVNAQYNKPKINLYSYSEETKYIYDHYEGYGYFNSENQMEFMFEIEKEIMIIKINKKSETQY